MRSRVTVFVSLALIAVVLIPGVSGCTRAKPNRPLVAAPTVALADVVAEAPAVTQVPLATTETAASTSAAEALPTSAEVALATPVVVEGTPTMVPGMPTPTEPAAEGAPADAAPDAGEPAPAVTLIIPLTPEVDLPTPDPSMGTPGAVPSPTSTYTGQTQAYMVKQQDTLFSIAYRFGTTVDLLKEINNLSSDLLSVGQELRVPVLQPTPAPPPVVIQGEQAQAAAPDLAAPAPSGSGRVHVVSPGENLFRIALKYGISLDAIAQANNIMAPWYTIYVGQRLVIP